MDLPEKFKIFIWKCLNRILPVRTSLAACIHSISIDCPLCHNHAETIEYLFFLCQEVRPIWFGSQLSLRFDACFNLSFQQWLLEWLITTHRETAFSSVIVLVISILWCIWKSRNNLIFLDQPFAPTNVLFMAMDTSVWISKASEWNKDYSGPYIHQDNPNSMILQAYPDQVNSTYSIVQILIDGSWKANYNWSGCGFVVYSSSGNIIASISSSCFAASPLYAEYLAAISTLLWAQSSGFTVIYLYTDCVSMILQASGSSSIPYADRNLAERLRI